MISAFKAFFSTILSFITILDAIVGFPVTGLLFRIDNAPTVFESGDAVYTVMWTTNAAGTGSVSYTFDGKEYTVNDSEGGNIRSTDTVHSVRVPKEHLDNNTYTVSSQSVPLKAGYFAIKGRNVTSDPISFRGYNGQKKINALVLSDIHSNMTQVRKAVSSFDGTPDMVILNGDILDGIVLKEDFTKLFEISSELSKGEIPVAYARGNHEPRGQYASEMIKYFRTSSGGLYYTFSYGPISAVVLDCGEDKPDDHKEYSGLVDFSAYIAQETKWLEGLAPDTNESTEYRLCITHNPRIDNEYGNDWTGTLEELGIDAAIYGHYHLLNLNYREGEASFSQYITGGKNGTGYIATMMTFEDGTISFESRDENAKLCGEATLQVNG